MLHRARAFTGAVLAGLCAFSAGCHSASTVGFALPRLGTAAGLEQRFALPGKAAKEKSAQEIALREGMEVQWALQTAKEQPGLVKGGSAIVGPDGTVEIGPYGTCKVAGMSMSQATAALEKHVGAYVKSPTLRLSTMVPASRDVASGDLVWRSAKSDNPITLTQGLAETPPASTAAPAAAPAATPVSPVSFRPSPKPLIKPILSPVRPSVIDASAKNVSVQPSKGPIVEVGFRRKHHHGPAMMSDGSIPGPIAMGLPPAPGELNKITLPPYVIGPPDILLIESLKGLLTQPVRGQHLVRPDGTVGIGSYGSAQVAGLTLDEAKDEIARVIHSRLDAKAVTLKDVVDGMSVDVLAYNSKVYYVITDGGGYGEQVVRIPVTGGETVLDAIGQIGGLPWVASKHHIWVARRSPGHGGPDTILPVDWIGISQRGATATNYQIMPGDRVYVRADRWRTLDATLAKVLSPFERVLGITLLGSQTVNSISTGQTGTGR